MTTPTPSNPLPSDDATWELVARYIAGELSAAEASAVHSRLAADPGMAAFVDAVARAQQLPVAPVDAEAALQRVHTRMRSDAPGRSGAPLSRGASRPRARVPGVAGARTWWLAAAAAVVAIAGVASLRRGNDPRPEVAVTAEPYVFKTGTGKRDSVVLTDGSRVVLGPGSSLSVPATFPANREVTLTGEALFDVVHDTSQAFVVRTATASITDVGTRFTVRTYEGGGVDVAVQSGKVELRALAGAASAATLRAGDAAEVNSNGALTHRAGGSNGEDVALMRGALVFRDAPMAKVRADLLRWHGVLLRTTDAGIASRHLTASFQRESRKQVLDVVALAFGARYTVRADTVTLHALPVRAPRR